MENFLTIPEEIFLLTIDENGENRFKNRRFDTILASSILMDLALQNRIDTDLENVIPDNSTPTGNPILDTVLFSVLQENNLRPITWWLSSISEKGANLKEEIISSLVDKEILTTDDIKVFWMFRQRKYPIIKDKEIKDVKERVRDIVFFKDEIPDFRDIVIVSLIHFGDMKSLVFSPEEIEENADRIEQLAKMDLVGQAISKSLKKSLSDVISDAAKNMLGIKSPEEQLTEFVEATKKKFKIKENADLPEWLRKGTVQYEKTLQFVREKETADIIYKRGKYFVKKYSASSHSFGSGD